MRRIGLVLSGGMGKGAYQIGALQAINEFFQPSDFDYVSAASIGALNTYAYLTNNLAQARSMWESVNLQGNKHFIASALKKSFIQTIVSDIVSGERISNSFYVPLLDLSNMELDYCDLSSISSDEIALYLQASITLPFYNKGIAIGNKSLYDGAVIDNIPIYPVITHELDYIICVYFDDTNYIFENCDHNVIKLTFPDDKIIANSISIKHDAILHMMNEGYRRAKEVLSYVFVDGTENMDDIKARIKDINAQDKSKKIRITGDVVVTNMNKITKKVIRYKRIMGGDLSYK